MHIITGIPSQKFIFDQIPIKFTKIKTLKINAKSMDLNFEELVKGMRPVQEYHLWFDRLNFERKMTLEDDECVGKSMFDILKDQIFESEEFTYKVTDLKHHDSQIHMVLQAKNSKICLYFNHINCRVLII